MDEKRDHPTKPSDVTTCEYDLSASPANHSSGTPLEPRWSRYFQTTVLLIIAFVWVGTTIWFSFATSRLVALFALPPNKTVDVLTICSNGTAVLLAQLVPQIFEHLRWTFGSRRSGISFNTFLALGGATSIWGVMKLLWHKSTLLHRVWCSQRLLHLLISTAIGSILLLGTTITPTFVPITEPQIVDAGYGPFNSSLVNGTNPEEIVVSFLIQTGGLLSDSHYVASVTPFNRTCASSDQCYSVVMPGSVVKLNLSVYSTNDDVVYVIENATGYQLDFYTGPEQSFQLGDCLVYPTNTSGLSVCVKNVNNSLNFGWSLCPPNFIAEGACMTNLSWITAPTLATYLSTSSLRTTTTYAQRNSSILTVIPSPNSQYFVDISAAGIRSILDYAVANSSTSVALLMQAIQLSSSSFDPTVEDRLFVLRGVLSLVAVMWGADDPELGSSTGYYATSYYHVAVNPISRVVFTVLSVGVLTWSLLAMLFCWFFGPPSPNTSEFPEVDFAAKLGSDNILVGLGNATDEEVIKGIQGKVLCIGSLPSDNGGERVMIATGRRLNGLQYRQPYL